MNNTQKTELETSKLFLDACRTNKAAHNMSFMLKHKFANATEYVFFSPAIYKTIHITKKDTGYTVRIDGMMHVNFDKNHQVAIYAEKLITVAEERLRREQAAAIQVTNNVHGR